jgi:inosine-uridine nucleoside N-ribohydrolase
MPIGRSIIANEKTCHNKLRDVSQQIKNYINVNRKDYNNKLKDALQQIETTITTNQKYYATIIIGPVTN